MHKTLHEGARRTAGVTAMWRRARWLVMQALITAASTVGAEAQPSERRVALTFDDLVMTPEVGGCSPAVARAVNEEILAGLRRAGAPATGLVNASRTCNLEAAQLRDPLLESWLDAGHVLGNHTWSHPDLEWTELDAYLADARRGGESLDSLLAPRGTPVEWFRHPLLHAGDTPGKKEGLSRFLEERGWRVAPVTVDNQEWVYAYVYHVALRQGDTVLAERVAEAFLDHIEAAFEYFERRSREVVGREIAQILLLHANRLVADHIDEILAMIRTRGYDFVTLADAVADPAYERGDPWLGKGGPSWIERWAVADGGEARQGPREHAWVAEEFRRLRDLARSTPERVGPGVISTDGGEGFPALSPSGERLWFATHDDSWRHHQIVVSRLRDGAWTAPIPAPFSGGSWSDRAPRPSPDGRRLFFASNRPKPDEGEHEHDPRDYDIWVVERDRAGAWSQPRLVPEPVSTAQPEYHPSLAASGALYFASFDRAGGAGRSDLYVAWPAGSGWSSVASLGDRVNSAGSEPDVYVDPAERFLIVTSTDRPGGLGHDDLYISLREEGGWSPLVHLGKPINSDAFEYGASVSPDGKWLWFTSHREGSADLFRIRTSSVPELARALGSR